MLSYNYSDSWKLFLSQNRIPKGLKSSFLEIVLKERKNKRKNGNKKYPQDVDDDGYFPLQL